jgi:hypothetical protein
MSNTVYTTNPIFVDALIYFISPITFNVRPFNNRSLNTNETIPLNNSYNNMISSTFNKTLRDISKWITKTNVPTFIVEASNYNNKKTELVTFLTSIIPDLKTNIDEPLVLEETTSVLDTDEQIVYDFFKQQKHLECLSYYNENNLGLKTENFTCKRTQAVVNWAQCQECINNKQKQTQLKQRAKMMNIDWSKQPCLYECKFKTGEKLLTEQESIDNNSWVEIVTPEEKKSFDLLQDVTNRKFLYAMHFPEASTLIMADKFEEAVAIINLHLDSRKQFLI